MARVRFHFLLDLIIIEKIVHSYGSLLFCFIFLLCFRFCSDVEGGGAATAPVAYDEDETQEERPILPYSSLFCLSPTNP